MKPEDNESQKHRTINLRLEDESYINDHPRHLTIHSNHIFAIGGEDGFISATPINEKDDASTTRVIRKYDEPVKALAFSDDGQRVAVGYDDGFVDIYVYSKEQLASSENHPFLLNKTKRNVNDEEKDTDDFLHTQSSQFDDDEEDKEEEEEDQSGPSFRLPQRFEASIRHLQFQPNPSKDASPTYYLAIAAEASPGFKIVNVTKEETSSTSYLDDEASTAYKKGGVRSVSFSPNGNQLMTMGMDGRTCVWSTQIGGDPQLDWELIHEDILPVVDRVDTGAFAEIADKSLYPVWNKSGAIVAIPGCVDLKFRKKDSNGAEEEDMDWLKDTRMVLNMDAKKGEDGNGIVGLAFDPKDDGYVIASTKDGGIGLWRIDYEREENDPEGTFLGQIHKSASMCTHILWHKDERNDHESLYLALQNGSMVTFSGRDSIVKEELVSSYKKTTSPQKERVREDDIDDDQEGEKNSQSSKKKKRRLQKQSATKEDEDNVGDDDDDLSMFDDSKDAGNESVSKSNQFIADEAEENMPQNDDGDDDDITVSQFDDVIPSQNDDDLAPDATLTTNNTIERTTESTKEAEINGDYDDFNTDAYEGDDYVGNEDDAHNMDAVTRTMVVAVKPQIPFAPSSTPLAERTILCWNHIGVITSRDENQFKSIDISFTDAMSNRPVSFTDNMHFVLGSLGEDGAIFSTDLVNDVEDDDDIADVGDLSGLSERTKDIVRKSRRRGKGEFATGSCVYFHRFESFGTTKNKDWFITLPEGEKVLCCAAGAGWNAVATSRRFLRTFTSGGVQGPIIWLRGDPVTMVGRGRFLAVFFHESNPINKTQKLGYSLYDGITMREIACDSVAGLSSESSLSWAGFSNDFALSIMDDDGMLSMLMTMKPDGESNDPASFSWAPMLDTVGLRKSREDSFWPVSVQNGKLICVPLKGGMNHPNPARRPLTTSLQLRIPLARDGNDKSIYGMEEVAVRANMALEHKNFLNHFESNYGCTDAGKLEDQYDEICAQVDKITLKLLFKKIEGEKLEAALDLVHRLHLEKSFEIAMDVADRSRHRKLSDKIYAIMEEKFNSNQDDDDSIDDESYDGSISTFSRKQDLDKRGVNVSPEATENSNQNRNQQDVHSERPKSRKRINPFATNSKKSPGKSMVKSPAPKKPMLSRLSSFSAESRRVNKASKEIL